MWLNWLEERLLTLPGKFIIIALGCIVGFTLVGSYLFISNQKGLYLRYTGERARTLIETASINFTNVLMYADIGIQEEEAGLLDYYISDLMEKEKDVAYTIVLDNGGKVLAHSNLQEYGEVYKDRLTLEALSSGVINIQETLDEKGRPILDVSTPLAISTKRWGTLRVGISLLALEKDVESLKRNILYLAIVFILFSLIPIAATGKALSKPIVELSGIMDRVNYGEFEHYLQAKGRRDEIGQLQVSFLKMLQRLRDSDLEWENTFNSITDLISIHDRDFRIIKANRALAQRLRTTPSALVGRHCHEVFHNLDTPCQGCPHGKTLEWGQPATLETSNLPLRGIFLTSTYPIFDDKGGVVGTVHIAKDITEEKRLQENLIQSEKMAAIGLLVSGVAHEINNPLGGVLNALYTLSTVPMDPKKRRYYLNLIQNGLERIQKTVRQLLDFAQQGATERVPSDINEMVEHILSLLHHTIDKKGIRCEKRLSLDLPRLLLDRNKMEQVLMNLTINAIQSMESGGVLTIATSNNRGFCSISIKDTGKGIPQEILPRIFDPFFTTKDVGEGTGLGLSVSKGIVEQHNGTIEVETEVGKGSTFRVKLPLESGTLFALN